MLERLLRVLLTLMIPVYGVYLLAPAFGYMHDDGLYLITSQALAETGRYTISSLPTAPLQSKYPILYPALLVPLWKITTDMGTVAQIAKVFSLLCTVGWILLLGKEAQVRLGDKTWRNWFILFCVTLPWCLYLSASVLPDSLFALLTMLAIIEIRKFDQKPEGWRGPLIAGLLVGATFLLRTTGLALVLAGGFVLLRRRISAAVLYGCTLAAIAGPWLVWQAKQPVPADMVQAYYSRGSYQMGHIFAGYAVGDMVQTLMLNILLLALSLLSSYAVLPVLLGLVPGAYLLYLVTRRTTKGLFSTWSIEYLWSVVYVGMLMCWVWPPQRYLTPVLPWLLLFGMEQIKSMNWSARTLRLAPALLAIGGLAAVGIGYSGVYQTLRYGTPSVGWGGAENWHRHLEIASWLKKNTPQDAVLAANLDPLLFHLTGRKGLRLFSHKPFALFYEDRNIAKPVGTIEEWKHHLETNHVRYVVLTEMKGFGEGEPFQKLLEDFQRRWPSVLQLEATFGDSKHAIYRVNTEQSMVARGTNQ